MTALERMAILKRARKLAWARVRCSDAETSGAERHYLNLCIKYMRAT